MACQNVNEEIAELKNTINELIAKNIDLEHKIARSKMSDMFGDELQKVFELAQNLSQQDRDVLENHIQFHLAEEMAAYSKEITLNLVTKLYPNVDWYVNDMKISEEKMRASLASLELEDYVIKLAKVSKIDFDELLSKFSNARDEFRESADRWTQFGKSLLECLPEEESIALRGRFESAADSNEPQEDQLNPEEDVEVDADISEGESDNSAVEVESEVEKESKLDEQADEIQGEDWSEHSEEMANQIIDEFEANENESEKEEFL